MKRAPSMLLAFLCASPLVQAQILAVHLTDERGAARYKRHLMVIDGREVLVGEARSGLVYDPAGRSITYDREGRFELFLADPRDPEAVPYRLEGEQRITTNRRQVLGVQGSHVDRIQILIEHQNLAGLAREYRERLARIAEQARARDAQPEGSASWFAAQRRMLAAQERLRSWLDSTTFPAAALELRAEIERQRKTVETDAFSARLDRALAAIRVVETPEHLVRTSSEITGGRARFRVMESQHIRITALEEVSEERLRALLELGERVIDGFRADCIDPYVDETFEDRLPAGLFSEFWFGPPEREHHERFYVEYYRQSWGDRKQERLDNAGQRTRLFGAPEHLEYFKLEENRDLEGVVAHGLGHSLVAVHYNLNRPGLEQGWLVEGCALYLALEYLGRNTVTCMDFAPPGRYARPAPGTEGDKTVLVGLRAYYNALALSEGPPIDRLARTRLYEMVDGDIAKSWSLFDYIVRKEGRRGQELLRSACRHGSAGSSFIQRWRADAEQLWQIQGQDVFRVLDDAWRAFAASGQDTGDTSRRRSR